MTHTVFSSYHPFFERLRNIGQDALKVIALITMTLDHTASILDLPGQTFFRIIGRASFPIFVFLLVSHLAQKGVFTKYIARLLPFAVLTTFLITPFKLIFNEPPVFHILWSLLLPVITLFLLEKAKEEKAPPVIQHFISFIILLFMAVISLITEYGLFGFCYILLFYFWMKTKNKKILFPFFIFAWLINLTSFIPFAMAGVMITVYLLFIKETTPHKRFLRPWWIFYSYYPAHLVFLYTLKYLFF